MDVAFNKTKFVNFSSLLELYDTFILDLWGVVHDGYSAYLGVAESIKKLLECKKNVFFLSNAPRPGSILLEKLIELGIPVTGTRIFSSGDAVRLALKHPNPLPFYHLGGERNKDILKDINLEMIEDIKDIEKAGMILLSAYVDEGEDLYQYLPIFEKCIKKNIPLICANPDTEIINGKKIRYCAGVFADQYEKMGGKVYYYGKPHPAIYDLIFDVLEENEKNEKDEKNRKNGKNKINKDRILMVGDTLNTDILGAKLAGIHSALTKTGNTALYLARHHNPNLSEEEILIELFQKEKMYPNWVIPAFRLN